MHPRVEKVKALATLISVRYALNKSAAVARRRSIHHRAPASLVAAITIFRRRGLSVEAGNCQILIIPPAHACNLNTATHFTVQLCVFLPWVLVNLSRAREDPKLSAL